MAAAACVGIAASASLARAQSANGLADDDAEEAEEEEVEIHEPLGTPPEEFRRFEVVDMTLGLRDDFFGTVSIDPRDGTIYVGSGQGRFYRSRPGDTFWDEATVVPEVKNLYGFAGQKVLLGSLRGDGANPPGRVPISDTIDILPRDPSSGGPRDPNDNVGGTSPATGRDIQLGGPRTVPSDALRGVIGDAAEGAAGGGGGTLGVGLSAGAPRLSILLAAWGRTVPVIKMSRMLATRGVRSPAIWRIVPHPQDKNRIYVGTGYGLYTSSDGGVSFVRTFPGMSAADRGISAIVVDPTDPDRVFLGTTRGMYVSTDRGDNWQLSTTMPGVRVQAIAIDPTDPNYIYVASNSGLFRSADGGNSFQLAFYHTLVKRRNVGWVEIDPFDPETVYLATHDGVVMSDEARRGRSDAWKPVAGLRTVNLTIPKVSACTRHPGHLYIATRADLPTINYGAHGPEAYIAESWDGGDTWRILVSNRTQGDVRWFELDPEDPDRIYVVWSRAIGRLERIGNQPAVSMRNAASVTRQGPSMGEVLEAALDYHGLRIGRYNEVLEKYHRRAWVPRVTVQGYALRRRVASDYDDAQFADDRFLGFSSNSIWGVMAWATWPLPELVYRHEAHAMIKLRVNVMNDEVRNQVVRTIHRNYGELQRLRARLEASPPEDLYTRAMYRIRMEQLEAIVDLASGGYLSAHASGSHDAE